MSDSMNDREYRVMADVEGVHWWYRGLRDLIGRVIDAKGFMERSDLRVLDAGCGTGENLRMIRDKLRTSYLGGFDASALALDLARRKVPEADLYQSDLCRPELRAEGYDLVLNCDVLCVTGLEPAREGMLRIVERMRPGGLLIVNLPAYQWLYSRGRRGQTRFSVLRGEAQGSGPVFRFTPGFANGRLMPWHDH